MAISGSSKRPGVSTQPVTPHREGSGAFRDILLATTVLTLPLLLISALLLELILKNRVNHNPALTNVFQSKNSNGDEPGVYYVDFSATRLTTLASWSSSLAPLLPGFLMTLLLFSVASTVKSHSERSRASRLPTPYQLSLMLGMSTGGPSTLWDWVKYMFWKRREKTVPIVKISVFLLTSALFLTYFIWAADTWLHVTTTTVLFDQVLETISSKDSFGRRLSAPCTTPVSGVIESCNINIGGSDIFFTGAPEGIKILSNSSTINEMGYTVLGDVQYSYIADKAAKPNTDFSATTYATHVSCTPISTDCNLSAPLGASTPFHCSDSFFGDLTSRNTNNSTQLSAEGVISGFFFDQQLTQPITNNNLSSNPAYFAVGTIISVNDNRGDGSGSLPNDPQIVNPVHGGLAFILRCEVDVYDMQYISINGTLRSATFSPSNSTVSSLFIAPYLVTAFPNLYVYNGLQVAGISNTSQQIADKFALSLSQITVGASSGILLPAENLEEQQRTQFLVARVPMAPLFTLIGANLVFVLLGLVMAMVACLSGPRRNNGVRKRLTLPGVVASLFEDGSSNGELFGEARESSGSRVGISANGSGAWDYHALNSGR